MISLSSAMATVEGSASPLDAEPIPLSHSMHRVLREDVCAPEDQPAFDRSAVDGYAIRQDDPWSTFTIVDRIRAGQWTLRSLQPGQAVQIATGAALPCGGLQVVMKEDAQVSGDFLKIERRSPDTNVRYRGEDARQGQVLVRNGTFLGSGALALLASLGHTDVLVTRLPRILHVATGNEIVPPEAKPGPGQIRDSNSVLIRGFLNQWGIDPKQMRLPEDEAAAFEALSNSQTDILLISGGASVGEHDFTGRLLARLGYEVRLSKTNTRPGKPLIFGVRGNSLAFGLPGNPLAHFVCLNLFVRVAIEKMSGRPGCLVPLTGSLANDLDNGGNSRETLWPSRFEHSGQALVVHPLRWSSSGDLTCLASANALARITGGSQRLSAGTSVEFFSTQILS